MTIIEAIEWVTINGNKYAQSYAKQALVDWDTWDLEAQRTQCLYILTNMQYNHRACVCQAKQALRDFIEAE